MAKNTVMQTVRCVVNIGGDLRHSVVRDSSTDKIETTYAEAVLLRSIHGEQGVTDIEPVGQVERPKGVEKERLINIYGANAVNFLYPGVDGGNMPTHVPGQVPMTDDELIALDRAQKNRVRHAAQSIELEK